MTRLSAEVLTPLWVVGQLRDSMAACNNFVRGGDQLSSEPILGLGS